jgi:hypothetical protein
MSAPGFLRRTAILIALAWVFRELFFKGPEFIRDAELRESGVWVIYAMTAWAVITLLANRIRPKP